MKTRLILSVAVGALLLAAGCGKKQEPAPPAQGSDTTAPGVVQKAADTAQAQAQIAKEAVQNVATNVQAQAADVTGRVQGVIDQAKKLMGENKLTEALSLLNGLSSQQLSADQQSLVQSLKAQIQKALDATKAAGGLLPPTK